MNRLSEVLVQVYGFNLLHCVKFGKIKITNYTIFLKYVETPYNNHTSFSKFLTCIHRAFTYHRLLRDFKFVVQLLFLTLKIDVTNTNYLQQLKQKLWPTKCGFCHLKYISFRVPYNRLSMLQYYSSVFSTQLR